MIYPALKKSAAIKTCERRDNSLILRSERGMHRIIPFDGKTVRITYTERPEFSCRVKPGVTAELCFENWTYTETEEKIIYSSEGLIIETDRKTSSMTYLDGKGEKLLSEAARDPKQLEMFDSYILANDNEVKTEKILTADGVKEKVLDGGRKLEGRYFHTRLYLEFSDGEALYGLGQHEEGNLNLRGKTVYSHQANRKIEIPFIVSTNGYGILYDTYSPLIFSDNEFGSYIYSEADDEMDYYFISDSDPDGVIREYRMLTGKAVMLPKWAFGYVQSRERYESSKDLTETAAEFRRRGIGLDLLVLDWNSWPDGLWGQKTLDPARFPDPDALTDELHRQNVHLMMSIWPNPDVRSDDYREFKENGCILPAGNIYDAYSAKAREIYWRQLEKGAYSHGVDSWWCDSSEPFTPEWNHIFSPEPFETYKEYVAESSSRIPAWKTSAYCLYHAMSVYDGQRSCDVTKRVLNLTRSGYTGQQRYGAVLWSGDVSASWDTMKKQIAAGLSFSASGLPYWTVDVGAFFVKYGLQHYWSGEYPETTRDAGYRELYTRWLQWGAFLPIFRSHGTDCYREPWNFEDNGVTPGGNMFYDAIVKTIRQRYRLMPYIYSVAASVYLNDESFIKPLAFEFGDDENVYDIKDQYMFGDSMMICPVTHPMYYAHGSEPIENVPKTRRVYLPSGTDWYSFETSVKYSGGQYVTVPAELDTVPVFVRAGSIIPVTEPKTHTEPHDDVEYLVYSGKDASFMLYEDAGDGYGYENGEYKAVTVIWNEKTQTLTSNDGEKVRYTLVK